MNILIIAVLSLFIANDALAGCPGCCSHHGGISSSCTSSGRIYCEDGTVSPSCTCAKCGVSSAPIPPAPTTYALIVTKTGLGTVTSSPLGIACGTDCSESFTANTAVTLTAKPNSGSTLSAWSGCSASGLTCTVKMTAAQSVSAIFSAIVPPVTTDPVDSTDPVDTTDPVIPEVPSDPNPVASADPIESTGFIACLDQFPNRKPPTDVRLLVGNLHDLCFEGFAVRYSGESKTPVFVVEKLNRARLLDADETRTDDFTEANWLPATERATLADYAGSGYDRGHMAPAADMPTPTAMAQSFSLANVVPQAPTMNRGIWANSVEQATRDYVMRATGDVFVFTGPINTLPRKTIGAGEVWIPNRLFKLVYDSVTNRAWAFVIENKNDAKMIAPVSYSALQARIRISLLPGITPKK